MDITTTDIEFMGEIVGGTILVGESNVEPLLGVTALESVGIEVDPNNQRLRRLPAIRLKRLRKLCKVRNPMSLTYGNVQCRASVLSRRYVT